MPVGIDIGATRVKLGTVDRRGRLQRRGTLVTRPERGPGDLLDRVAAWIDRLPRRPPRVGVGFCGMVDAGRGLVLETTDTMPGFGGLDLARELEARTGAEIACDNDGNCAALCEAHLGVGRGAGSLAMLTLGTGVGGGLIVGGELVHGAGFMAGKLGHLKVRSGGRRCACGARGCLEAYLSAWALRRMDDREPPQLVRDARAGEPRALELLHAGADALGTALSDIANTFNPEVIAVGGGLAAAWPVIGPRALDRYRALALPRAHETTRVRRAKAGAWAGVVGAALL